MEMDGEIGTDFSNLPTSLYVTDYLTEYRQKRLYRYFRLFLLNWGSGNYERYCFFQPHLLMPFKFNEVNLHKNRSYVDI